MWPRGKLLEIHMWLISNSGFDCVGFVFLALICGEFFDAFVSCQVLKGLTWIF